MNAAQRNTELYRIAYQCALLKQQGCNGYCGNCQLNTSLYIDDAREAVLIKTNAAIDAEQMREYKKDEDISFWVKFFVVAIFCISFAVTCHTNKLKQPKPTATPTETQVPRPIPVPSVRITGDVIDYLPNIIRDVNGDGQINCIDWAVVFYEVRPDCRIIRNQHPTNGFHHLFIAIPQPGNTWLYIEPNTAGQLYYRMDLVWGDKYDPRYNRDETHIWKEYAK